MLLVERPIYWGIWLICKIYSVDFLKPRFTPTKFCEENIDPILRPSLKFVKFQTIRGGIYKTSESVSSKSGIKKIRFRRSYIYKTFPLKLPNFKLPLFDRLSRILRWLESWRGISWQT